MSDPFLDGADKVPSVSFDNAPVGYVVTGTVVKAPEVVQSRSFETGELEVWPDTGRPKQKIVTRLEVDGEERNLWCSLSTKPGSMRQAIADAVKLAGAPGVAEGATLAVKYTGEEAVPGSRFKRKLYAAKYDAPKAADPFAAAAAGDDDAPPF